MKSINKLMILLVGFVFILTGCTNHSTEKTKSEENTVLRVGMEASYEPFNWTQSSEGSDTVPIIGGEYAGGYDVMIAKHIGEKLGREVRVVKLDWDGLIPALQSGKIDLIVAGMSPTEERMKEIDFTQSYYQSELVVVTRKEGEYAKAKSVRDFSGARVTGQLGTFHYDLIDQLEGAKKLEAMSDFSAMRVSLESGKIDAYVSEKNVAEQVIASVPSLKMIEFRLGSGFDVSPDQIQTAIGVQKGSPLTTQVNDILAQISPSQRKDLMAKALRGQTGERSNGFFSDMWHVFHRHLPQLLNGAGVTLYISLIGTVIGLFIGLLVGIIRTIPAPENKFRRFLLKLINWLMNAYIEIFRGTPMIVQAMVVFYGSALLFQIDMDKTFAALLIVSVNTGAYMSEVVRGGVLAIDKGQFEACQAIGMTHLQSMQYVVLPQVMKNILPATGNEFVINIKDTSVLNVIGVTELYFVTKSIASTNYQFFQTFLVTCLFYFVMTFTVTRILRYLEKRLSGKTSYTLASGNQMQV